MNIGFDAKRALFNRSGLGNYSRSTLRLLSRYFPDNRYFLFTGKQSNNLFLPSGNQTFVGPDTFGYSVLPAIWRTFGMNNEINQTHLDVFHGLSNELPWNINKTNVKSVVTIHDLIFLRYPEYYSLIDRNIYSAKFSHACRIADKIIATSESTKQDIIRFFGTEASKIEVVYQTCDPIFRIPADELTKEEVRRKYDLPEQYILYVGTIEKRKNALTLVKAYLNKKTDIPLVLVGKPTPYLAEIKKFLLHKSDSNRVLFRHNIETPDLPVVYQSARVFVYPSLFEGFGIPIVEALLSGVPIITSNGSCFGETAGEAAMYCDPFDVDQMGDCIHTILNEPETREQMISKGFLQATRFSEEVVASNLMGVYTNL